MRQRTKIDRETNTRSRIFETGAGDRRRTASIAARQYPAEAPGRGDAVHRVGIATPSGNVTFAVSLGVAVYRQGSSADDVVAQADAALYQAKRQGRDRVCAEPQRPRLAAAAG